MRKLLLWLVISGCHWQTRDYAIYSGLVFVSAIDLHQTDKRGGIADHCLESNPIIGECGQAMSPLVYMPLALLIALGVAEALPPKARTLTLVTLTSFEAIVAADNYRLGWGL